MQNLYDELFDEFMHLESVLNDMYSCKNGVTNYIELMEQVPYSDKIKVYGWEEDYKNLKHIRHIRNARAHDPNYRNVVDCTVADVEWLKEFYDRVISVDDPYAKLRKIKNDEISQKNIHKQAIKNIQAQSYNKAQNQKGNSGIVFILIAAMIILVLLFAK